jgi:polysaccharide biosynthesis protein PslG
VASRWLTTAALLLVWTLALSVTRADTRVPKLEAEGNGGRVGISTSTVWLPADEGYVYLRRARDAGITWVREDFAWSAIEPERGHFSWRRTDALMRNTSRLGINVLGVATYAPEWASGHTGTDKYPPTRAGDFATFVKTVADRYARGGTFWRSNPRLVPSPLTAIELWNEPWLTEFWHSGPDPAAYARLVRAAATAVKAAHPSITLLASGDVSAQGQGARADWLEPLLHADPDLWRSGLVGAWSVHLYCQERSPWDTTSPQRGRFDRVLLTGSLAQQAGADKPIWITEFGWSTDPSRPDAVSEQTQARYERDALVRAVTEWGSFVPRSFVFTWTKPSPDDRYNLVRPDGSTRPAWQAIESFISSSGA